MSYLWYVDGFPIEWATNATLTLTNFVLAQPVQLWVDAEADTTSGAHPKRFYRAVPVP